MNLCWRTFKTGKVFFGWWPAFHKYQKKYKNLALWDFSPLFLRLYRMINFPNYCFIIVLVERFSVKKLLSPQVFLALKKPSKVRGQLKSEKYAECSTWTIESALSIVGETVRLSRSLFLFAEYWSGNSASCYRGSNPKPPHYETSARVLSHLILVPACISTVLLMRAYFLCFVYCIFRIHTLLFF